MIPNRDSIQTIHFSGICGTAMASLAVLLKRRGYRIQGSDANVYPPMSTFLAESGVTILEGYAERHLDPAPDLVVVGNALSRGNPEVEAVLERDIPYISMAELLKEFFIRGRTSLVVSGTHGKTTTTSLLAWVFEVAGHEPGFMVGGIPENLGTSCRDGGGKFFITEGDEYDTAFFDKRSKFLHYRPNQVIINNVEFDHADIFDSLAAIQRSFALMLRLVPRNGLVVANGDEPSTLEVVRQAHSPVVTFGTGENCAVKIREQEPSGEGTSFLFDWSGKFSRRFRIPLLGEHNVRNATGVIVLALHNGLDPDAVQRAFDSFIGVKRRLELKGSPRGIALYDDFAHHPTAIRETIRALRRKHPKQKLFAVFEPRSNTSVLKVHQAALAQAFEAADAVLLSQPHRMEKIPADQRLDVEQVVADLKAAGKTAQVLPDVPAIVESLAAQCRPDDVILVMSNGKFGDIHTHLLARLA